MTGRHRLALWASPPENAGEPVDLPGTGLALPDGVELARWRSELGSSSRLWGGRAMRHELSEGHWLTLSGARSVEYNVAVCHGMPAGPLFEHCLAAIADTGAPGLVMAAGEALGATATLVDAGWNCVGAVPFMVLRLGAGSEPAVPAGAPEPALTPRGTRCGEAETLWQLDSEGVSALRSIAVEAFGLTPSLAELAIPSEVASDLGSSDSPFRAFGLVECGRLVSGVVVVTTERDACIWSMATPPSLQRRGFGRRLLEGVLAELAGAGFERLLLIASKPGLPLYRSVGFAVVEHWQVWSSRRWLFG